MSDRRRATTLVETLVALTLLAFVLISVGTLFPLALAQVRAGARASIALATARTILERIELQPFDRIRSGAICAGETCAESDHVPVGSTPDALPDGRVEIRIEPVDEAAPADAMLLRIVVVVCWTEGARSRCTRLATVRS